MINLALNEYQAATLANFLEATLSDLSVEIAGTDRKSYRDAIKRERSTLETILEQLRAAKMSGKN